MNRYSEAVNADVCRRKGPPHRQNMAEISQELGIYVITLYKWSMAWRLQGKVVPASRKDPVGWGSIGNFTVVPETAGLHVTGLTVYCRERGLFPEKVARRHQAAQDANAQPLHSMADQNDLQKCPVTIRYAGAHGRHLSWQSSEPECELAVLILEPRRDPDCIHPEPGPRLL